MLAVFAACNDPASVPEVSEATASAISPVGVPGWQLADTPTVAFNLDDGSPAIGIQVTWSVREGGGSVRALDSVTDGGGRARAVWVLGPQPGPNRLGASSGTGVGTEFAVAGDIFRAEYATSNGAMACGLASGELWCWEPNGASYLDPNRPVVSIRPDGTPAHGPVRVSVGISLTAVAVARKYICGLDSSGAVWCADDLGQPFAQVAGLPPIRGLVSNQATEGNGVDRFCGLALADSAAWCWRQSISVLERLPGSPAFRRIWYSKSNAFGAYPVAYPDTRGCGLLADSTTVCWGRGAPGDGSAAGGLSALVPVTGGARFVELAVGDRFTCGRKANGETWCWGGVGGLPDAFVPVLFRSDALLVGAWQSDVSIWGLERRMARRDGAYGVPWDSPDLAPFYMPPVGLEGLPVARFAENSSNCLFLAGGEVYCSDEAWTGSSYRPVPPRRP